MHFFTNVIVVNGMFKIEINIDFHIVFLQYMACFVFPSWPWSLKKKKDRYKLIIFFKLDITIIT